MSTRKENATTPWKEVPNTVHEVISKIEEIEAENSKENSYSKDPFSNNSSAVNTCLKLQHISDNYEIIQKVGEGAYGSVFKVSNKADNELYALKLIPLSKGEDIEKLKREVKVLAQMKHENIVGYSTSWISDCRCQSPMSHRLESVESEASFVSFEEDPESKMPESILQPCSTPEKTNMEESKSSSDQPEDEDWSGKFLVIQMQYCHQTLHDFIDKGVLNQDKEEVERIFREIIAGLKHMHDKNIIHRDLKPANVFLDSMGHVKIGDFGLARHKEHVPITKVDDDFQCSSLTKDMGTAFYAAPELQSESTEKYGKEVDLYSLGIILFEMVYSFQTKMERAQVLTKLRDKDITFPEDFTHADHTILECIKGLLMHNTKERFTINLLEEMFSSCEISEETVDDKNKRKEKEKRRPSRDLKVTSSPNEDIDTILRRVASGVGRVRWSGRSASLCFHVGDGLIFSALVPVHHKRKFTCSVNFEIERSICELKIENKNIIWKNGKYRSFLFQVYERRIPKVVISETDICPPGSMDSMLTTRKEHEVYIFHKRTNSFIKTALINLSDYPALTPDLPEYMDKDGFKPEQVYIAFLTDNSNSNAGAPVILLSGREKKPEVCGMVIGSLYVHGVRVGTMISSMRRIFDWTDPPIPMEPRRQIFSDTFYALCHENLLQSCLDMKNEISVLTEKNKSLTERNSKHKNKIKELYRRK